MRAPTTLPTAPLLGLHHVTAVTGDAPGNLDFYTRVLGLRLVKKTVNQDDVSAYHLFYGDELGNPGTELTFFDWPNSGPAVQGAGAVTETALRIPGGRGALEWWVQRFDKLGVRHGGLETSSTQGGVTASLPFFDPENQPLRLRAEDRTDAQAGVLPWRGSPAPPEAAITGLSAVTLNVRRPERTIALLKNVLGFRESDMQGNGLDGLWLETGAGGPGAQVRVVAADPALPFGGYTGSGGVHHVAFRVADAETQRLWHEHLVAAGLPVSDIINRFYFRSIYFREPGGVLFEIATDGPGFAADEDAAHLGERLSLPPFLEPQRRQIEAGLRPLG
jgi:glyoxalase family protein